MLDSVTETIAHFIGEFDILTEEARLRQEYDAFRLRPHSAENLPATDVRHVPFSAPLDLTDFTPDLRTIPAFPEWAAGLAATPIDAALPLPPMQLLPTTWHLPQPMTGGFHLHTGTEISLPPPEAPGSTVLYLNQQAALSDNDHVSVGGSGLAFHPASQNDVQLAGLANSAEHLAPLTGLAQPDSPAAIGTFIDAAKVALADFSSAHAGDPDVTIVSGPTPSGIYVNGVQVQNAPDLAAYLPAAGLLDSGAATPGATLLPVHSVAGAGSLPAHSNIDLDTGSNLVVNEAHISNISLGAAVVAVGGSDIELNAIMQVTAYADHDQISARLGNWVHADAPTQSLNIAQFGRIDPTADTPAAGPHAAFPSFWAVTQIQGDLVYLNWVKQFAFVNDHDVILAAASGSNTSVITGENETVNAASISDLGHYYDLIVCGGNIYTANMISQVNVLVDNDLVGAVSGFQTCGQGSVSTGDNLLWNSAGITNIGAADRFQALPDAYKAALGDMASGNMDASHALLGDSAFAGLGAIRVLYVSGSIYNLNYIDQHTIVGDSDQVALAMSAVAADPTANWNIVTGSNAVANIASITNLDALGKTYVGGDHYSDAMLVQSGLVPSASDMQIAPANPDALVNEAVAFLTDPVADHSGGHNPLTIDHAVPATDHAQSDVMHGMLA